MYSLFGLCWRTVDLYLLGEPGADTSFIELREQATALGSQSLGYVASVLDVMRTFRRGELDETERLAAEALTLGTAAGDADALSWFGGHLLAVRWAQGRLEEMHDLVTSVIESSTLRRLDQVYPALLAYTAALRGDVTAARSAVNALLAEDRGIDRRLQHLDDDDDGPRRDGGRTRRRGAGRHQLPSGSRHTPTCR